MIDLDKILAITKPDDAIAPPPIRYGGNVYRFRPLDIASVAALEAINAGPLPDDPTKAEAELLDRGQRVVDAVARMFDGSPPPFCATPLAALPDDRSRQEVASVVHTVLTIVTRWFTERSRKKRLAAQEEMDRQVEATIYPPAASTT